MNSSVKQAQKEGAALEDISAGLSSSIVKNAIYKVIRFRSADELGNKIVCQGGTFLNDAILRAFELETGKIAIRPSIAGLMGAFGAALYAKEKGDNNPIISSEELNNFSYKALGSICQGCGGHCNLTIIRFNDKRVFISGNKCEKGEGKVVKSDDLNLYAYKNKVLDGFKTYTDSNNKLTVGLPMGLIMYEQLPVWSTFFKELGFNVVTSDPSSRDLYFKGQSTIPSDTVCYPAKLMHGHIASLLEKKVDFIFYPSSSYNLDEGNSDNHFNCPVVAYYGELLKKNNPQLNENNFYDPFLDLNNVSKASKNLVQALKKYNLNYHKVKKALQDGLDKLNEYHQNIFDKSNQIIKKAREEKKVIIVLAGRPYHIDEEINHGVDKMMSSLDLAIISEDVLAAREKEKFKVDVLNQWTYHARLYKAAKYVTTQKDMELVQLVSFGCGVDAITTDEVREILEAKDKFYTQLKIDEISNLGTILIRLRSLKAAIEEKEQKQHV